MSSSFPYPVGENPLCGSIRIADRARFPTSINALAFNHLKFYPVHLPLEICFRNLVLGMVIPLVPFIRSSGRKDAFVKGVWYMRLLLPGFTKAQLEAFLLPQKLHRYGSACCLPKGQKYCIPGRKQYAEVRICPYIGNKSGVSDCRMR